MKKLIVFITSFMFLYVSQAHAFKEVKIEGKDGRPLLVVRMPDNWNGPITECIRRAATYVSSRLGGQDTPQPILHFVLGNSNNEKNDQVKYIPLWDEFLEYTTLKPLKLLPNNGDGLNLSFFYLAL